MLINVYLVNHLHSYSVAICCFFLICLLHVNSFVIKMDDLKNSLIVPKVRKSMDVMKDILNLQSESLSSVYSPQATSTAEKQGQESLIDPLSKYDLKKYFNKRLESNDSSLGLLDIDNCKAIGEESTHKFSIQPIKRSSLKSLSFNPKEISARSTIHSFQSDDNSKENIVPDFDASNQSHTSVRDIIEKAKTQSGTVDKILKSSNDPRVSKMRESLESYRHTLGGKSASNVSWNYCSKDLKVNEESQNDSKFRDSMFLPATKINMSDEEMSWLKEKGDLPIRPKMSLMNSTKAFDQISFSSQANNGLDFSNVMSDSKMSVGNYFEKRCLDLDDFLRAPSPEKNKPSAIFLSESNGDDKSRNHKTLSIHSPEYCENGNLTNTLNSDDTISAFSLTQIRKMVGNLEEVERPSVVIDNMLRMSKKKSKEVQSVTENEEKTLTAHNSIFHSTKTENNTTKELNNPCRINVNFIDSSMKISPIKDIIEDSRSKLSIRKNAAESTNSSQDLFSTMKTFRKSTTGNNTESSDSTVKSAITVVNAKTSICLDPITESSDIADTKLEDVKKNSYPTTDMSPGIMSSNELSCVTVTPSDISNELKDLMSPNSNEKEKSFRTPLSGRHVKRLMDHYQHMKSPGSSNGWISPTQAKINDLSRECIPSVTPFRTERFNSPGISSGDTYTQLDKSDAEEESANVPDKVSDEWIKIESEHTETLVGMPHNVALKLTSQNSGWISVRFSINTVYVDDDPYDGDVKDVMILQAPLGKVLLKADSKIECTLRIITFITDKSIKIKLDVNMTDIVTQCALCAEHVILVKSHSPELYLQNVDGDLIESIDFPTIPEECTHVIPLLLWSDCKEDLPIMVDVKNEEKNVFSVIHVEVVFDTAVVAQRMQQTPVSEDSSKLKTKIYSLPQRRKAALLIVVLFYSPILDEDLRLKDISGTLSISLMPSNHESSNQITMKVTQIRGHVGISSLLIRNNQKSEVLIIHQGTSEIVEMFNAGSIVTHYKLYVAVPSDKDSSDISLVPCERGYFILDKSEMTIKPAEKVMVRVTYPICDVITDMISRLLVFESAYKIEVVKIVGAPSVSRCLSQQSTYSIESTSSQEIMMKSSKKELSWGSVKAGEAKAQDIVFKNVSAAKKLRLIISVIGEGFKVLSDNGTNSSMMITLQPQECRTLNVEFRPTHDGGHDGSLRISKRCTNPSSSEDVNKSRLLYRIPLHGVCGQSMLIFRDGVFRHAGSQGLPLGPFQDSGPSKEIYFTIWNRGTMPGFVLFNIELKWKYRSLGSKVFVTPRHALIKPGEPAKCWITVPRAALSLARNLNGDTEVVASLFAFHGDETTRLRIKKICNNCSDSETMNQLNGMCQGKLDLLRARFPDEDDECGNVTNFKESPIALKSLLDELQQKEVAVTYDMNLDYSIASLSSDLDETLAFHTICDEDEANKTIV